MALFRRSKLGFDVISRYLTSTITSSKPPIRNPVPIINHIIQSRTFKSTSKVSSFSSVIANRSSHSPFFGRCYHVDSRQLRNFNPRGSRRRIDNTNNRFKVFMLVGSGIGLTMLLGNIIETVPYTNRKHLVLVSNYFERKIGEGVFKMTKDEYEGKIVPEMDPKSVGVRMIFNNIIEALQRGLTRETKHVGVKLAANHIKGLEWEILVVNSKDIKAFSLPGGKIVVSTGLLNIFKTDEEVATIISHEVAHIVARHSMEKITNMLWFLPVKLILDQFVKPIVVEKLYKLVLSLPISRRMEIEADYIGMLLMASAGYDPRVAPKVFRKFDKISGDLAYPEYLRTHPSGKRRSDLLSETSAMQEAIFVYQKAIKEREIDTS